MLHANTGGQSSKKLLIFKKYLIRQTIKMSKLYFTDHFLLKTFTATTLSPRDGRNEGDGLLIDFEMDLDEWNHI